MQVRIQVRCLANAGARVQWNADVVKPKVEALAKVQGNPIAALAKAAHDVITPQPFHDKCPFPIGHSRAFACYEASKQNKLNSASAI